MVSFGPSPCPLCQRPGTRTAGVLAAPRLLSPPPRRTSTCCGTSAAHSRFVLSLPGREHLPALPEHSPRMSHGSHRGSTAGGAGSRSPRRAGTGVRSVGKWGAPNPAGHGGCPLPGTPGCSGRLNGGAAEPQAQGAPLPSALGMAFSCERVLGQRTELEAGAPQEGTGSSPESGCLQRDCTRRNLQ